MTNEQYLIVSYFTVGLLLFGFALATYLWLRNSFIGVTKEVPGKLSIILRRLFFIGIILPVFYGFFSVSYRGCGKSYEKIIASRAYLVAKNQEQLSTSISYMVIALLIWGFIILGVFFVIKRHKGN